MDFALPNRSCALLSAGAAVCAAAFEFLHSRIVERPSLVCNTLQIADILYRKAERLTLAQAGLGKLCQASRRCFHAATSGS
jgi:hypothetical protein